MSMQQLKDLVDDRQSHYFKLVDAQQRVDDADHDIKRALVDLGAVEALSIQWGKLRRMIK